MADFSTTVSIIDNFSSPLQSYREQLDETSGAVDMLSSSIGSAIGQTLNFGSSAVESIVELVPMFSDVAGAAHDVADSFREMIDEVDVSTIMSFVSALAGLAVQLASVAKNTAKTAFNIGKFFFQMQNRGLLFASTFSTNMTKKMVDTYKKSFLYVNRVVGENIDALNLEDKMVSMWGDDGKKANNRMYKLANELGENAGEVMQAAAKAASGGIGTDEFEQVYRFADKIAKLNPGDSTSNVAQTLLESIRNGHDAESITSLLGGGEMMTRELKRRGYGRKLDHGDFQGALNIAKEVAEKAGYTQDKYEKAGRSLSNDFKFINNVMTNIKNRLGEIYSRHFEPIVHKIADIMRSNAFQMFIKTIEKVVDFIGEKVASTFNFLIDNWGILVGLVSVMVFSKIHLIGRLIGFVLKLKRFLGPVVGVIFGLLKNVGLLILRVMGLNLGLANIAKVSLIFSAKFLLISGLVYAIYKGFTWISDEVSKATGKTVSWKGVIAGLLKSAQNGFQRFFTMVEHRYHAILRDYYKMQYDSAKEEHEENKKRLELSRDAAKNAIHLTYDSVIANTPKGTERFYDLVDARSNALVEIDKQYRESYNKSIEEMNYYAKQLNEIVDTPFEDLDKGVAEAVESEGQTMIDEFSKWFKDLIGITDEIDGGVKGNNNILRRFTEQEEELRWLKAFSDRQITSQYNQMTSYNRTVNINGMSQAGIAEMGRRSVTTRPSRAAM